MYIEIRKASKCQENSSFLPRQFLYGPPLCWKDVAHVSAVYTGPWLHLFPDPQAQRPASCTPTPRRTHLASVGQDKAALPHCAAGRAPVWASTHSCVPLLLCDPAAAAGAGPWVVFLLGLFPQHKAWSVLGEHRLNAWCAVLWKMFSCCSWSICGFAACFTVNSVD